MAEYLAGTAQHAAPSLAFLARHPSLLADLDSVRPLHRDESDTRIGDWRLQHLIAHGGFASVYAATKRDQEQPVAIKLAHADDARSTALLRHEFRVTRGLDHPGLLLPRRFEEVDGRGLLVSARLPGPDLGRLLARDDRELPPEEQVLDWFARLAGALAHLHSHRLVHRDVKPGNLVLDHQGRPRLIDFGLATAGGTPLGPGLRELAGTLPYMSPEQTLGGLTAVGPASDVYSAAVTMLELLQGAPVAARSGRASMLESIAFAEVPLVGRADRPLTGRVRAVFARATRKAPSDRYPDAVALLDDLQALRSGAPLRHATEPVRARLARRLRRHRFAATGVAVALLAVAAVLLILWWSQRADARAALSRLEVALVDEQPGDALLAAFDAAWQTDPSAEALRQLLLDHRDRLGRRSTQRILATTGLRATEPSPLLRAEGRMARRIHSLCGGADFVLQSTWAALLTEGPQQAAAALRAASPAEASDLRLLELEALIAAELLDAQRLAAAESRLRHQTGHADLTVTELCLRAFRLIHRVQSSRRGAALQLAEPEVATTLDAAESLVDTVLATAPDCRLARTCDALLDLWRRRYAAATTRFVELATRARDAAERHALQLHATLAQSCRDGSNDPGTEGRPAPLQSTAAAWWLARYAALLGEEPVVAAWLCAVVGAEVPTADRAAFVTMTANSTIAASRRGDWRRFRSLVDRACDWDSQPWPAADRTQHAKILLVGSVVAIELASHHGATDRDDWWTYAQRTARRAIDLELPRRAEFEAVLTTRSP